MEQAYSHQSIHLKVDQKTAKTFVKEQKAVIISHGEVTRPRLEGFVYSNEERGLQLKKKQESLEVHTDAETQVKLLTNSSLFTGRVILSTKFSVNIFYLLHQSFNFQENSL